MACGLGGTPSSARTPATGGESLPSGVMMRSRLHPASSAARTKSSSRRDRNRPRTSRPSVVQPRSASQAWRSKAARAKKEMQLLQRLLGPDDLVEIDIAIRKADPCFAPRRDENPLDNEIPDINSDGRTARRVTI